MKRSMFATAAFVLGAVSALAQPIPAKPGTYVADNANILTPTTRVQLMQELHDYEKSSGNEFAVLTTPNLEGFGSVEELANKTFHSWGIGKKGQDNGLLLVVSMAEHKFRLEVGYGLEGKLPDARAGQILRATIPDNFQAKRFDEGVTSAVNEVIKHLARQSEQASTVPPPPPPSNNDSSEDVLWVLGVLCVMGIGFALWVHHENKKDEREAEARRLAILDSNWPPKPKASTVTYLGPAPKVSTYARRKIVPTPPRDTSYIPVPIPYPSTTTSSDSSYSSSSYDSSSSSSSSSDFGSSFGGGDSGGGGASGSW